jgi:plastocyanin
MCRRTAVRLSGELLAVARTRIVMRVAAGKAVAIGRTSRTVAARKLEAGQRVRVTVTRCRGKRRPAVAARIAVLPPPAPATVLELVADPTGMPRFDKTTLEAPAGRITLRLTNPSPMPHSIGIEGRAYGKVVQKGGVSTVTVTLKPGQYTYFCTVSGHRTAGMKGMLVVR